MPNVTVIVGGSIGVAVIGSLISKSHIVSATFAQKPDTLARRHGPKALLRRPLSPALGLPCRHYLGTLSA